MPRDGDTSADDGVLQSKRAATRYQILVEIAERQPAVSQREIADAIGITAQAVSDYLQGLTEDGYVDKQGRGRYAVTKEGVDWLIAQTDALRQVIDHVSENVIEELGVEAAIATEAVSEGHPVSLTMRDGTLHATPFPESDRSTDADDETATAVAVTDAAAGRDVGVTDVSGIVDYQLGTVTVVSVPRVQNGGSDAVSVDLAAIAAEHDLIAVAGTEALAAARAAGLESDLRFGTRQAVPEAAMKGLDVALIAAAGDLAGHADALRESDISYEMIDGSRAPGSGSGSRSRSRSGPGTRVGPSPGQPAETDDDATGADREADTGG